MGLQLFSGRKWKDDSFNETNVTLVLRNAKEMVDKESIRKDLLPNIEQAKSGRLEGDEK